MGNNVWQKLIPSTFNGPAIQSYEKRKKPWKIMSNYLFTWVATEQFHMIYYCHSKNGASKFTEKVLLWFNRIRIRIRLWLRYGRKFNLYFRSGSFKKVSASLYDGITWCNTDKKQEFELPCYGPLQSACWSISKFPALLSPFYWKKAIKIVVNKKH